MTELPPESPLPIEEEVVKEEVTVTTYTEGAKETVDNRNAGGGKVGSGSKKREMLEKNSEEYKRRRERNNEAVRKSRQKSRQKASETAERVNELKKENAELEQRVTLLNKELELLKDLFLSHANDMPDPSTTFGLFNANPSLGSSAPNPALSCIVLKTDSHTVTLSTTALPGQGIKTET
ncbi:CCAAT/enhancer-binding protein gamma-like [Diadema antillarum]|uniref:CCAAT/enhancer-binding protein gamma-like n=1 Tax=Diadema antillarum TaxID=105358 RepID=UPI003A85AAED